MNRTLAVGPRARIPFFLLGLTLLTASGASQHLRGRVLDPDGEPVAGARVQLVAEDRRGIPGSTPPRPVEARTGKSGRFALDAGGMIPQLSYSLYVVSASHRDHRTKGLVRPKGAEHDLGDLRLAKGQALRGVVTTEAGRGIPKITVRFWPIHAVSRSNHALASPLHSGAPVYDEAPARRDGWVTTTDAEGKFNLRGLPKGAGTLSFTRNGFAPHSRMLDAKAMAQPQRVRLQPGRLTTGTVVDADEQPVAGARLYAMHRSAAEITHVVAHTDAKGRFTLPTPPDSTGWMMATLTKPGYLPHQSTLRGDKSHIVLQTGAALRLRVRDAAGQAVNRFAARGVHARSHMAMMSFQAIAAVDGEGTLRGLPPLQLCVEVRAPGYAPVVSDATQAGGDQVLDVTLNRGGGLRGKLVDPKGKPMPGATLEIHRGTSAMAINNPLAKALLKQVDQPRRVRTNANGEFRAALLQPGKYVVVTRHAEFVEDVHTVAVQLGATHDMKTVKLHRGVRVHGTTTRDGKPAPNTRVTMTNQATRANFEVTSDAKGEFDLTRVPPGKYMAMAGPPLGDNPFKAMVAMNKNKRVVVVPDEKAAFRLEFPLKQ